METKNLHIGYNEYLIKSSDFGSLHTKFANIRRVGVDAAYFSDNRPTALFKNVEQFDNATLRQIANIHRKAWNYVKCLLLFVQSATEIRIYNCYETPVFIGKDDIIEEKLSKIELYSAKSNDKEALKELENLFSRIAVDNGKLWNSEIGKKIDLSHKLDAYLANSLCEADKKLKNLGLSEKLIHSLLLRSLFILFLEDKGAAKEAGLYEHIKSGSNSFFDILKDKDATYRLFEELNRHFNGNITSLTPLEKEQVNEKHLEIIRKCFTDGDISDSAKLFEDWRIFDFNIIHIDLLSQIYEKFLGEVKEEKGQYYTPQSIVDLILSEKMPDDDTNINFRILDPACGSGIFLVESYRRLIARWKKAHMREDISFDELKHLLVDNIFGIEIDPTAIKVTAFSLYIALIEELNPKTLWRNEKYKLPNLIADENDSEIKEQGHNLLCKNTIKDVKPEDLPQMDLVVGNPPYGTKRLAPEITEYCKKHKFAQEYVLPFIHKSTLFCPEGNIALVFNVKVLTNTNKKYQNFRKWLFSSNNVEKVYNLSILRNVPKAEGNSLFQDAISPICIVYFTPSLFSSKKETIEYWAPRTYMRNNLIDGLVINKGDVSFLPRVECEKPDTKIWKIAHWGNRSCFRLIERLKENFVSLKEYIAQTEGWLSGRGLNADSKRPDFPPSVMIDTRCIDRYYTNPDNVRINNQKKYRFNKEGLFTPPFVIFKEGQRDCKLTSTLFTEPWFSNTTTMVYNGGSLDDKKVLIAYFNSRLVEFLLFLITSTWGEERERIQLDEINELPAPFASLRYEQEKQTIVKAFDKITQLKKELLTNEEAIKQEEQTIFLALARIFNLSDEELQLIDDTLRFSMELFRDRKEAYALRHVSTEEISSYGKTLDDKLNTFLSSAPIKASICCYNPSYTDSLCLASIKFDGSHQSPLHKNDRDLQNVLSEIDAFLIAKKADSIYVQKNLTYYKGDTIYIIKPNQKRFWSRSQATEDAAELIADILNMEGSDGNTDE